MSVRPNVELPGSQRFLGHGDT